MNGQNIYNGCCTLRIDFSKLASLNVKYNNDKSRDYTNPGLPTGDSVMPTESALGLSGMHGLNHMSGLGSMGGGMAGLGGEIQDAFDHTFLL